jgi:thioredoxin-like negative regulator of GroEL
MTYFTLESSNRAALTAAMHDDQWTVACLCAAWCDVCCDYRAGFEAMAARHPDLCFVWIDIEDQADVVGDLDVENFPTLLIQQGDTVVFFGPVLPDPRVAERLVSAQLERDILELRAEAGSSAERRQWQIDCNLKQRMHAAADGHR